MAKRPSKRKAAVRKPARKLAAKKKSPPKQAAAKKRASKPGTRKAAPKKTAAKKAAPKKKAPKKTVAKKTPKKTAATKTAKKKPAVKKAAPRRVVVKIKSSPPPPAEEPPPQRTVRATEKSKGENPITLHHRSPTSEEYTELRKLLIDRRKQLLGDVKDLEAEAFSDESKNVSTNHLADSSFEQYEQEFNLSMIESEIEEVKQISLALEKIAVGGYGECEACGIRISIERLKVKPFSRICIHCRSRYEEEGGGEQYGVLPEIRV